ncbi:hypothetical protein D3C75_1091900 [compost metagenome]
MRSKIRKLLLIMLAVSTLLLTSCTAITAQQITRSDSSQNRMNGGGGMDRGGRGPGMDNGTWGNGTRGNGTRDNGAGNNGTGSPGGRN